MNKVIKFALGVALLSAKGWSLLAAPEEQPVQKTADNTVAAVKEGVDKVADAVKEKADQAAALAKDVEAQAQAKAAEAARAAAETAAIQKLQAAYRDIFTALIGAREKFEKMENRDFMNSYLQFMDSGVVAQFPPPLGLRTSSDLPVTKPFLRRELDHDTAYNLLHKKRVPVGLATANPSAPPATTTEEKIGEVGNRAVDAISEAVTGKKPEGASQVNVIFALSEELKYLDIRLDATRGLARTTETQARFEEARKKLAALRADPAIAAYLK